MARTSTTENVIAACQRNGVQRLIHTSSIDVCFNTEEDVSIDGRTPYATNLNSLYTESSWSASSSSSGA